MNLNQVTAYIGANASEKGELSSLVKEITKDERFSYYTVFLIFDLDINEIRFGLPEPFETDSVYQYNYFGNNPGASTQYYLTRDMNSVRYIMGTTFSDLALSLKKHQLDNRELYQLLEMMGNKEFIKLSTTQGQGSVNLNKLSFVSSHDVISASLDSEKKVVEIVGQDGSKQKLSFEKIIREDLNDSARANKYPIIIPTVLKDKEFLILSCHPDYVEVVRKEALEGKTTARAQQSKMCYMCGTHRSDVSYTYTTKFNKSRINKIYTTTTINSAPGFNKSNYDQVYSICQDCYNNLLTGEKEVSEKYQGRIAGERVFIIPEAIEQAFDYNNLPRLKKQVDLAFKEKDAGFWMEQVANESELMEDLNYIVSFVIYRTDGKSMSVLQVIEDVPVLRFTKVIRTIVANKISIDRHLKYMSLSSIYRIIPVRTNKKKEQIDIGRVLTLYKMILAGGTMRRENLYAYAVEALDKGLKQLSKSDFDNYYNMDLFQYKGGKEDFFIKRIVMSYLVLIQTCEQMGAIPICNDKGVFKGGENLKISYAPEAEKSINMMEDFLNGQGFKKEARALFYLGALINRVALAQLLKEHKTKPILKKISYQGMNKREVYCLYNDVIEKLRQYDKMTIYAEAMMNKFHEYAGKEIVDGNWDLSEQANVFYIMSGYAYMVGSKPTDIDAGEKRALIDLNKEDENNDNQE